MLLYMYVGLLNINYINNGPKIYEILIVTGNIFWLAIYFLNILPEIFLVNLKFFILLEKLLFYWKRNVLDT